MAQNGVIILAYSSRGKLGTQIMTEALIRITGGLKLLLATGGQLRQKQADDLTTLMAIRRYAM